MQNCQSPVSISQSVSEWHTIISARDVGASENPMQKQKTQLWQKPLLPPLRHPNTHLNMIQESGQFHLFALNEQHQVSLHGRETHFWSKERCVFGISSACLLKHSRNSTFINVFYLQVSLPKRGHVGDCWGTTFSGPVSFQLRERVPSISPRLDLAGEQETYHKFKLQIKWSFTACACNIFQSRLFIEAMTFRAKLCEEYKQETIKLFGTLKVIFAQTLLTLNSFLCQISSQWHHKHCATLACLSMQGGLAKVVSPPTT